MSASEVEYRDIPGFRGYRVGSDGTVWTRKNGRGQLLETWREMALGRAKGHRNIILSRGGKQHGFMVGRLILEAFVGPAPCAEAVCAYKNGLLDDVRASNLEWRQSDRGARLRRGVGENAPAAKLTEAIVLALRAKYQYRTYGFKKLAAEFGLPESTVTSVILRKCWTHLP